ncbi:phage portal protein [Hyphococcus sp.]|uniref:phage portal protein n=1 Tax=Hyphococcus sp. TaxID=2038636 RepID=UPI0035C7462C
MTSLTTETPDQAARPRRESGKPASRQEGDGRRRGKKKNATRAERSGKPKTDLYTKVTAKIVRELEAGRFPWAQPWAARGEGPNPNQSFPEFVEMLVSETLAHGNGLAEIVSDRRSGKISALKIIPWRQVTPVLLKSGRMVFDVTAVNSRYGGTGETRRLLDTEVLHLKDRSDDGFVGRSRLSRSGSSVRSGIAQEHYGANIYENQAAPSGMLSLKDGTTPENLKTLVEELDENWAGARNAGKIAIINGEVSFLPMNITPENLEMLAARRFTVEEIARLFQVPPPIIGDYTHNTFTNSQSAGRWFGQFTLMPWVRKLEEAFRRALFSEEERARYEIEFDMTALLRSDPEARWQAHEIAVRNDILTKNEVREIEGWNRRPELDAAPSNEPRTE